MYFILSVVKVCDGVFSFYRRTPYAPEIDPDYQAGQAGQAFTNLSKMPWLRMVNLAAAKGVEMMPQ